MPRQRRTEEQIIHVLRDAEMEMAGGLSLAQTCQKLGVNHWTFYRWRRRYGGIDVPAVKTLRALEIENARLKRLVSDLALDNHMLKEVVKKKF